MKNLKHIGIITQGKLSRLKIGEYFNYTNENGIEKTGIKVSDKFMVPVNGYFNIRKKAQL